MNPRFEVLGEGRTPMRSEEFRAKLHEEAAASTDARNFTETGRSDNLSRGRHTDSLTLINEAKRGLGDAMLWVTDRLASLKRPSVYGHNFIVGSQLFVSTTTTTTIQVRAFGGRESSAARIAPAVTE